MFEIALLVFHKLQMLRGHLSVLLPKQTNPQTKYIAGSAAGPRVKPILTTPTAEAARPRSRRKYTDFE